MALRVIPNFTPQHLSQFVASMAVQYWKVRRSAHTTQQFLLIPKRFQYSTSYTPSDDTGKVGADCFTLVIGKL